MSEQVDEYMGYTINEHERYNEDSYDELLDEMQGPIKIGSLTYSPSLVLKSVDPIAYRCGFNDMQEYYYTFDNDPDEAEYETIDDAKDAIDALWGD